jgi:glucoamylase
MRQFFEQNINIQGSGAVVASPDTNTPGGSYYYHWERDGALSMQALLKTAGSVVDVKTQMDAYVQWVTKVQQESDPHGQSVLAEPKYMIPGGEVFPGAWCRPQNDGPGLRSHTLVDYANALDDVGLDNTDLWPVIQIDLDWQAANWQDNGCDLWEEVQSNDFFWNRFTQRAALTIGSRFANKMGDSARAKTYSDAAKAVGDTLNRHYANGYIFESDNRLKDAAVIAALNDGYLDDGFFSPAGQEAAGTVKTLNDVFCNAFTINQDDTAAGIPGILYGRYDGDREQFFIEVVCSFRLDRVCSRIPLVRKQHFYA